MIQLNKQTILGVGVTNATKDQILQYITTSLAEKAQPYYIVTPNPEILVYAQKHKGYQDILNRAQVALPDGIGVMLAGRLLETPLYERIPGVDLLEEICREVSKKPITVGFLGGRGGVALKSAECLVKKYPGLRISFIGEEWDSAVRGPVARISHPTSSVDSDLRASDVTLARATPHSTYGKPLQQSTDILFVAFGFPKQEEWMAAHIEEVPVRIMVGVGGAFDYLSGQIPRAPLILRNLGLEWLYRLLRQPWRVKRQLALLEFLFLVIKARLRN